MPDDRGIRARLLEGLAGQERGRVEDVAALLATVAASAAPPPPGLEERTLAAIRSAVGGPASNGADSPADTMDGDARPGGSPAQAQPSNGTLLGRAPVSTRRGGRLRLPRLALAGGLATVVLGLGGLAGSMLERDSGLPRTTEVEATLRAPGGAVAEATVHKTGIGRVIDFRTADLPILPTGEFYELWFVGPGDRPGRPNRISAGTFHPDENGRSDVRFTAAVDPARYPGLAVTTEPGDGNPAPAGDDVLRSALAQP